VAGQELQHKLASGMEDASPPEVSVSHPLPEVSVPLAFQRQKLCEHSSAVPG